MLPVHKEGLKYPLCVVEAPICHSHCLHRVLVWDVPAAQAYVLQMSHICVSGLKQYSEQQLGRWWEWLT